MESSHIPAKAAISWQYIIASAIALTGALFGGVSGFVVAAFAGDASPGEFAMRCFLFWGVLGGACLGASPAMIWLLCLRQRWVLPFLWAAGCALLASAFQSLSLSMEALGPLYAGVVVFGFLVGFLIWIDGRRPAKRSQQTEQEAPSDGDKPPK